MLYYARARARAQSISNYSYIPLKKKEDGFIKNISNESV